MITEKQFLKELKIFLHKEWRKHFKNQTESLKEDEYIEVMLETVYASTLQSSRNVDLTFSFVYDHVFDIITSGWEEKLKEIRKDQCISKVLNLDELKYELSEFLKELIPQLEIFSKRKNKLHIKIDKFVRFISPLFKELKQHGRI